MYLFLCIRLYVLYISYDYVELHRSIQFNLKKFTSVHIMGLYINYFTCGTYIGRWSQLLRALLTVTRRRCPFFAWLTSFSHILVRIFLLFTFLLWHSLSSTYFCCTQLSFSQFSPGITLPQLNSTLHNFATHTSALAEFCLSSVFYLKV